MLDVSYERYGGFFLSTKHNMIIYFFSGVAGERGWLEEDEPLSLVIVKIIRAHYDTGRKRRRGEVNRRMVCGLDWLVGDGRLSPAIAKIIRAHYGARRKK